MNQDQELTLLREIVHDFNMLCFALTRQDLEPEHRAYIEAAFLEVNDKTLQERTNNYEIMHRGDEKTISFSVIFTPETFYKILVRGGNPAWWNLDRSLESFPNTLTLTHAEMFMKAYQDHVFELPKYFPKSPEFEALTARIASKILSLTDKSDIVTQLTIFYDKPLANPVPPFPERIGHAIVNYYHEYTSLTAKNQATTLLSRITLDPKVLETLWKDNDNDGIRAGLAQNPNQPLEFFSKIGTKYTNIQILRGVAANPKCPPALLVRYINSDDQILRSKAETNLKLRQNTFTQEAQS